MGAPTKAQRQIAYDSGEGSRCISHDKTRNPYPAGTMLHDDWNDGWEKQDRELNK